MFHVLSISCESIQLLPDVLVGISMPHHYWLVISILLKNISQSMSIGMIIPKMEKQKKFQTTNQITNCHFFCGSSFIVFWWSQRWRQARKPTESYHMKILNKLELKEKMTIDFQVTRW